MKAKTPSGVVQWKAALFMYHLWLVMDLRNCERCKSSSNTHSNFLLKDLQAFLKIFKVNFVVVVVVDVT